MINHEFSEYHSKELQSPSDYMIEIEIKKYIDSGWILLNISSHHSGGEWGRIIKTLHFYKLKEKEKIHI